MQRIKQFRFDWKLSLFTVLLFPILLSLGFWQLDREAEKLQLQSLYDARQSMLPVNLNELDSTTDLQYVAVQITGHYLSEYAFFLDNKILNGQVGVELIQPFINEENVLVFINRGWMAMGPYRNELPVVEVIEEELRLEGDVYVPVGKQFMLAEETYSSVWPQVIQNVNIPAMAQVLDGLEDVVVFPYIIRLAENQPGALQANWQVITTQPEKHRGYAVQWFTMATVLLFLYLYRSTRTERVLPKEQSQNKIN